MMNIETAKKVLALLQEAIAEAEQHGRDHVALDTLFAADDVARLELEAAIAAARQNG